MLKLVLEEPDDEREVIGIVLGLRTWKRIVLGTVKARDVYPMGWVTEGTVDETKHQETNSTEDPT